MDGVQEGPRDCVTPWYVDSFRSDYLERYAHRDDAEADREVRAICRLLGLEPTCPLLDLACGAGRHLLALHRIGFLALTGIDLSADLLAEARRRLDESGGSSVRLVRADMRRIPFRHAFEAVLSLFTSFGYFAADRENEAVLDATRDALRPGGTLLIDTLNAPAAIDALVRDEEIECAEGSVRVRRRYDPVSRRIEKTVHGVSDGRAARPIRESVRIYDGGELRALLEGAGFCEVTCYGSLDGTPYTPTSARLVAVGRSPKR
ncbi:MAG: class I SAM-dependent methyltransferase [Candidatus Bipolaricaulota bacterium]|nr:MAG: class I SAM-dependent methyltransferase [Candidatus Bipolaricaulota bacterium]